MSITRPRPSFNLKASFDSMGLQIMSNLLNTVSNIPNYITNNEKISGLTKNDIKSIMSSLAVTSNIITKAISQGYFTQPDINNNVYVNSLMTSDADTPVYQCLFSFSLGQLFDTPLIVATVANNNASLAYISANDASISASANAVTMLALYNSLKTIADTDSAAAATAVALAISSPSDINSAASASANNVSALSTMNSINALAESNNAQNLATLNASVLTNAITNVAVAVATLASAKTASSLANNKICLSFPLLPIVSLSVGNNVPISYMSQLHQLNDAISIYIDSQNII